MTLGIERLGEDFKYIYRIYHTSQTLYMVNIYDRITIQYHKQAHYEISVLQFALHHKLSFLTACIRQLTANEHVSIKSLDC